MMLQDRLGAETRLNARHRHTYDSILDPAVPPMMEWSDLRSFLSAVAAVEEGLNGSLHVTRNGETMTLGADSLNHVASAEDLLAIRRFLERSRIPPAPRLLVIVGHHAAKIYRDARRETEPRGFEAYDPHGFGRLLTERGDENDDIDWPERKSYYDAIAMTLRGAGAVLIFGCGFYLSRAMDQLVANLNRNHADVAERIIGTIVVDMHLLTEEQLLARAGEYFDSEA